MEHKTPLDRADRFGTSRIPGGLALSGTIDLATWPALAEALGSVAACEAPEVVLDLSGVGFVDSHGVSLIVDSARGLGPARRLLVRGAPPTMLRIADVLNLRREPRLRIEGLV